jgi:arylsulfatase A
MKDSLFCNQNQLIDVVSDNCKLLNKQRLRCFEINPKNFVNRIYFSASITCLANLSIFGISNELSKPENNLSEVKDELNFVFIMVDDLGWTDLGCYGSDLHETPNIDRLAGESMKFTDAYSAAPLCSPTRAALMTGKHPARLNMTTWYENSGTPQPNDHHKLISPATIGNLPLDEYSIAKAFKDAGYFTVHVGKWHLGDAVHFPEAHGFDFSIGCTVWGAPISYWYPFKGWRTPNEYRFIAGLEDLSGDNENTYLTDRLTDEALKIIRHKKDEPFFLHMSYYTPHTPIEGKPDYVEYFKSKIKPGLYHSNPVYAAMIASLDENVGRILKEVEKAGISDRTVIIFYSDNGGSLAPNRYNNHPLKIGKGTLYEGGIRVPFIIKWPGVTEPGSISDVPVTTMDFYPTLLEIANITGNEEHNKNLDGISIVSLLKEPEKKLERNTLFWHFPHYYFRPEGTAPQSAVRRGSWKLIHFFEDDRLELYNLDEDIGEKQDLVNKHSNVADELYKMLQTWRKEVNAKLPSFNPGYKPEFW